MIDKAPLKFGIVGAGAIAQTYCQAFQKCEYVEVVGVADVRREAADAIAAALNCPSYDCYQEMAVDSSCDAVIVCTPPVTHPEICIWLLRRGVHVLCEKPLAIDSTSARAMLAAAAESGVVFTMASKFRYVEDVIRAKSIVTSGMLGDIMLFENCFTSCVDMSSRWNSNPAISGGGVLIDNGTHSVDIMRYFLGPLADLQVVEGKRHQGLAVEDTIRAFIRTPACVIGSIDLSWSMHKGQPHFISIYGSGGTLHVGWQESKYRRHSDSDWQIFGKGYDKVQAFRSQILNFAGAVRGEERLRITSQDALASVEVIEIAYEALRRSRWQQVGACGVVAPLPQVHQSAELAQ